MLKKRFLHALTNYNISRNVTVKSSKDGSKYRDRDLLPRMLDTLEVNQSPDWKKIREELLKSAYRINEKNVDNATLNYYVLNKKYEHAKKYIEFLNASDTKPNLSTIGKYFKLHSMLHDDNLSNQKDEENIINLYEDLRKEHKILDSITIENIITGLSATKKWKTCLDLLEESKITSVPNNAAYNSLIAAAFRNNENELGWRLFDELIEKNRTPSDLTYRTILNQIKTKNDLPKLEKLFETLTYHDLTCNKEVGSKILEASKYISPNASFSHVSEKGVCSNCKATLQRSDLTVKEFDELKTEFFKNVIVGRDVFCKTTPQELEIFKTFVQSMEKSDIVIDGLNVAYSQGVKHPPIVIAKLLAQVVNYFKEQGKSVLVMGRKHMETLPRQYWNSVQRNARVFLTQDISQDDPYILYCALHCGLNTSVVTRDLMRSHLYLLKDKRHKKLFSRWLAQSRMHLITVKNEKVIFKNPLPYLVTPQKDGRTWHVPYIIAVSENPKNVYYKWICIKT